MNEGGQARSSKFHWEPLLGAHSLGWDEAHELAGADPDFHRRDLWEAIANGGYPEWELGMPLVPEGDEFGFDLVDATKSIPEESSAWASSGSIAIRTISSPKPSR